MRLVQLLPVFIVAASALVLTVTAPQSANACSVGPDFDLVRDSDAIVAGRFLGWDIDESVVFPDYFSDGVDDNRPLMYVPMRAYLDVQRVYKGEVPDEVTIVDSASLAMYDHEPRYIWIGPSGACGAFAEDPTGTYAILALWAGESGNFRSSVFGWFFAGEDAAGQEYEEAVTYLENRSLSALPAGGGPPPQEADAEHKDLPWYIFVAGAFVVPLGVLFVGAFVMRRGPGGH